MNDVTRKIRKYEKRQPITDKKFKFTKDTLVRTTYIGKGKFPDKRFDTETEGLSLFISPHGIKTFYGFKKVKMFNRQKLVFENNNSYKKIFRFEDTPHRDLVAAKNALPNILKELSEPKTGFKDGLTFETLVKDFLKNGTNDYRLIESGGKLDYKKSTIKKYTKILTSYILLKGGKPIVDRMVSPIIYKDRLFNTPFKDLKLKDCTVMEVEALQQRLKNTKTLANDVLRVVSVVFAWAKKHEKYDGANPVRSVIKYRENKIKVKLSDMEVKTLMDHSEGKAFDYDPRFLGLCALSIRIGKRCDELYGIRWNAPTTEKEKEECSGWLMDNWRNENEKSYVFLHDTKNRTPERVFIDQATKKLLLRLERSRFTEANKHFVKSPYLFPMKRDINRPINYSSIKKKLLALNKKFGWTYEYDGKIKMKFTIKISRKTFGSKIASKYGTEMASRKLNHKDTKVTKDHYIVPEDSELDIENVWSDNIERFENIKKVK